MNRVWDVLILVWWIELNVQIYHTVIFLWMYCMFIWYEGSDYPFS